MKKPLSLMLLSILVVQYNVCIGEPYDVNAYNKAWLWAGEIDWNKGKELDLSEKNLSKAPMSTFNLSYVKCYKTNLSFADLSSTKLISINLKKANLFNANISNANLRYSILQNSNLQQVNLGNSDLKFANLSNANLTEANLQNTIFRDTNLENTTVKNADFKGARGLLNVQKAYLRLNGALNVPEDSDPEELVKDPEEIFKEDVIALINAGCKLPAKFLHKLWEAAASLCKEPDCG